MSIISYDFGHMEGGQDTSANGYLYEYKVNREYGQACVNTLKNAGHTMVNCTPENGTCATLGQSLFYRANKSNQSGAVLHLCFHANCYDDESAHGAEVEYSSSTGAKYAQSVLNEICKLGFASRGIKNPALYMTGSHVNAVSILLEPFFISNKSECNMYNPTALGNAVAKGVLNIIGGTYNPSSGVSTATTSTDTPISITKDATLKEMISALQWDLNSDYNAKLKYINGDIYQETLDALNGIKGLLVKGHKSSIVLWLKQRMIKWGYCKNTQPLTNEFDSILFQGITELQKNWNRATSGIMNLETWSIFLNNK